MRAPRLLLYGFGPYRQFRENITAKIIESLPKTSHLRREIFAVRFHRRQFLDALQRHKPDAVLGLGQSSRKNIELETSATNRRRGIRSAKARPIRRNGRAQLPTTLDFPPGPGVMRSKNAGDYVCNYSMYVMLEEMQRTGAKTRFAFIHIPHDFDVASARRVVWKILQRLRRRIGRSTQARSRAGSMAGPPGIA